MIACRSVSLMPPQAAISGKVRPQPKQSLLPLSMTHTLVQGEVIIRTEFQSVARSAHLEDAELVAVEIAEVGTVKAGTTLARCTLILSASSKGVGLNLVHDFA